MTAQNQNTNFQFRAHPGALALVFCILVLFPLADQIFSLTPERPNLENRDLAPFPKLKLSNLDPFPKKFDAWVKDHFKTRDDLFNAYSRFQLEFLHDSPKPEEVVVSKEGWFFSRKNLAVYQNLKPFSESQLDSIQQNLEKRQMDHSQNGRKFYVMIAPNKHSIYPEKVPLNVVKKSPGSQLDQVMERMKNSKVQIIDLREILLSKKPTGRLYDRTDTHWNDLGAFWAAHELLRVMEKDFPSIHPTPLDEFTIDTIPKPGGNLVQMIDLSDRIQEDKIRVQANYESRSFRGASRGFKGPEGFNLDYEKEYIIQYADSLQDVLVIRDSYTDAMIPFLKEHFHRACFIFDAWRFEEHPEVISNLNPQIEVIIILESHLWKLLGRPEPPKKKHK
ncbi:MAG: hypothetical protein H6581_12805 [Bacteroidia bacterium]|nr:hypothetical protein [Bacteroidia bacterium]